MRHLLASLPLLVACQPVQVTHSEEFGKQAIYLPAPSPSQINVDIAMGVYRINRPENCLWPIFIPKIAERGLTNSKGNEPKEVYIGPAAFRSWAVLGSTLAHEIEVHCNQNVNLIILKDLLGLPGTAKAEGEAYGYELAHAKRFGLSVKEMIEIRRTVLINYPTQK